MRYRISTVLLMTGAVCIALGWWIDRSTLIRRHTKEIYDLKHSPEQLHLRLLATQKKLEIRQQGIHQEWIRRNQEKREARLRASQ